MPFGARIDDLLTRFGEAHGRLLARLHSASEAEATSAPRTGGWTPAQIGAHVAAFDQLLAQTISGELPLAHPAPDGFTEIPWADIQRALADPVEAPARLHPPADTTHQSSLASLAAAGELVTGALRALTPARGGLTVTHPRVGTITLVQAGDWIVAHTIRHNVQLKRVLGR